MEDIKSKLSEALNPMPTRRVYQQDVGTEKVVFVASCWRETGGMIQSLDFDSEFLFKKLLESTPLKKYQIIPAIKDFNKVEEDLETEDFAFYRPILMKELEAIQPDLIIPLGNVALRAVLKSRGIYNKRGCEFFIESETTGKVISVCPTYSEDTIYLEPAVRGVFKEDITNYCNKVIYSLNKFQDKGYIFCDTLEKAEEQITKAINSDSVGCDTETTGLDFKTDVMTCFGASFSDRTAFIIPLNHFESPFTDTEIEKITDMIAELHAAPVLKLYANVKFDIKFLMEMGITEFNNCQDIQFMHSLVDENRSHALMNLVKKYYPLEIEVY